MDIQLIAAECIQYFEENLSKIRACLALMDETEIWTKPSGNSNAVGNQLLHLVGNIRQYVLSGLAGRPDLRDRSFEFNAGGGMSKTQLLDALTETVAEAVAEMKSLNPDELYCKRAVQGRNDWSVTGIMIHVTQHFSYHTGQIVFWTKMLRDVDMAFYTEPTLNDRVKTD
ncbi:MAG: DUF1572 family protein [Bacteroidetes Order II. Incertae sedis bacterium]|nr:DUF1572 family protein [Bacteroidetes Order II. bacterium]